MNPECVWPMAAAYLFGAMCSYVLWDTFTRIERNQWKAEKEELHRKTITRYKDGIELGLEIADSFNPNALPNTKQATAEARLGDIAEAMDRGER